MKFLSKFIEESMLFGLNITYLTITSFQKLFDIIYGIEPKSIEMDKQEEGEIDEYEEDEEESNEPIYDDYYSIYENIDYFIIKQNKQFLNIKDIYDYVINFYMIHSLLIDPQYINNVITTLAIKNGLYSKDKLFFEYYYYETDNNVNYDYDEGSDYNEFHEY